MHRKLTVYLFISLSASLAAGQAPPLPSPIRYRIEALPNPLVIPWGNVRYTCTQSTTWLTNTFQSSDCAGAIQKFHDIEVVPKRSTVYEYIQAGAPQSHPTYYGQATPRQYTHGIDDSLPDFIIRLSDNHQVLVRWASST